MAASSPRHHTSRKGLTLPLKGIPSTKIDLDVFKRVKRVGVLGSNYLGLRARLHVEEGDTVKLGQLLFEDRRNPGVHVTSPGAGTVVEINRGERRALVCVVIELDEDEQEITFKTDTGSAKEIRQTLLASGLWSAFRTRPFDKVPGPDDTAAGIFVTAYDTHPLSPPAKAIAHNRSESLARGLEILARLGDGTPIFLSKAKGQTLLDRDVDGVQVHTFDGPHPAGTPGFQMHSIQPVSRDKMGWYLNLADAIAIGQLFETGHLSVERIVAIAGPGAKQPRLVRTRLGADLIELLKGEIIDKNQRIISGSVLGGDEAKTKIDSFLGRYNTQITLLPEPEDRQLFGWLAPGTNRFSVLRLFAQKWLPGARAKFSADSHGSRRVMIPIGVHNKVFPFETIPTYLLRSLLARDDELAQSLGCLELSEEDVAPCSFVCPSKIDYQSALRATLNRIEKDG
jgi:Na+-transporting NADH:ubiquinone oxidoreductase subunit A